MANPTEPERLNQEGLAAFAERAEEDSPVVMLNLLSFKPDGGRERYAEYGAAVAPLLEKAGAKVVFVAGAASPLIGEDSWDMVLLVEYPSRQAFLDMIGSEEYRAIGHLRTEALVKGELHPMEPADGDALGV
ncbi:MAG TPA: DUF1330 domain-containing protein [Solirubrobacterales bacterium]